MPKLCKHQCHILLLNDSDRQAAFEMGLCPIDGTSVVQIDEETWHSTISALNSLANSFATYTKTGGKHGHAPKRGICICAWSTFEGACVSCHGTGRVPAKGIGKGARLLTDPCRKCVRDGVCTGKMCFPCLKKRDPYCPVHWDLTAHQPCPAMFAPECYPGVRPDGSFDLKASSK